MRAAFYDDTAYRKKQSALMKQNWSKGLFDFHRARVVRTCQRSGCQKVFKTTLSDPKKYCSQRCSALVSNSKRVHSEETKKKIATALTGKISPFKGTIKVSREAGICQNPACGKIIFFDRWRPRKYCSNKCTMVVVGARPTSPRAARAKAGKRKDLGDVYFYSRWEANFARILNHLGIPWQYQSKTFNLGKHHYTPDFYLPFDDSYIEIKNFLAPYSKERDQKFRELYPDIALRLVLKNDYMELEKHFAASIPQWEYRNSKFESERKLPPITRKQKI